MLVCKFFPCNGLPVGIVWSKDLLDSNLIRCFLCLPRRCHRTGGLARVRQDHPEAGTLRKRDSWKGGMDTDMEGSLLHHVACKAQQVP